MNVRPAFFSETRGICGPITARYILRFFSIYLLVCATGFALTQFVQTAPLQIFGLGLMLPGGGFLAHADLTSISGQVHLIAALAGMSAFLFSLLIWFATGNAIAPPILWFALALAGAGMGHGAPYYYVPWFTLLAIATMISTLLISVFVWQFFALRQRRNANQILMRTSSIPSSVAASATPILSDDDLSRIQFLLDRALQPLDRFEGFEWLDQFQTAAIRYQLNFCGYALSMAQFSHMPAFRGYLSEAQYNLVSKLTDHRVWKYWQIENLWGNLQRNADPAARENIMYTGFAALQMALHGKAEANPSLYTKTDSLQLRHPSGKIFQHSLPSLLKSLVRENKRRDFHLIACEPNWIYPLCNTIGAAALRAAAQPEWASQKDVFRERLEQEFIDTAGFFVPCRSAYTGLALPNIGGIMPQAMPCFFLNALFPDITLRHWLVLRDKMLRKGKLKPSAFWPIDTGNYRFSRAAAYAATALAAAEIGDTEIKELCLSAIDAECPVFGEDGHFYRPKASVWAHAVEFMARMTPQNGFRRLICDDISFAGPFLEAVNYDEALVAAAHHTQTGLAFTLKKRTNVSAAFIRFSGLTPQTGYKIEGAHGTVINSDADGRALWRLTLAGKHNFHLVREA
jgi:hypothetical protein